MQELKDFESVTMALQRETTTMAEVRALFDAIAKEYPIVEKRLAADADIVLDKNFESALVKLQVGKMDSLSSAEVRSVKHLKKSSEQEYSSEDENNHEISFADRILKRQKLEAQGSSTEYLDLRFLIPTSNICERLFSKAGNNFNERRMLILPINAESQMFLHLNTDLWNIDTVKEILSKNLQ